MAPRVQIERLRLVDPHAILDHEPRLNVHEQLVKLGAGLRLFLIDALLECLLGGMNCGAGLSLPRIISSQQFLIYFELLFHARQARRCAHIVQEVGPARYELLQLVRVLLLDLLDLGYEWA